MMTESQDGLKMSHSLRRHSSLLTKNRTAVNIGRYDSKAPHELLMLCVTSKDKQIILLFFCKIFPFISKSFFHIWFKYLIIYFVLFFSTILGILCFKFWISYLDFEIKVYVYFGCYFVGDRPIDTIYFLEMFSHLYIYFYFILVKTWVYSRYIFRA